MTTEQNNHEHDVVDELTSGWFDSELQNTEHIEPFEDVHRTLSAKQIKHATELRLLHSLLLHLADRDDAAKERRVQQVMHKIDANNQMASKLYLSGRPLVRYGIAAAIIIAVLILFAQLPSNTAMAAIDQMIAAIDYAGDRTYSIIVEDGSKEPRSSRHADNRKEPGERAGLDGATLYLRGSNQFVLFRQTPSGKIVINGSDGQINWHIRPGKPVLVSNNPEAFRIPMPPELAAILSLDLKATLLHIRAHYKVKYLKDLTSDRQLDGSVKYLDAAKISNDFPGPKNIEMWAEAETGLLLRIEFAGIHLQGDPLPKRLIIELENQNQLPEDWFTRQAHHPQDSEVNFVSE